MNKKRRLSSTSILTPSIDGTDASSGKEVGMILRTANELNAAKMGLATSGGSSEEKSFLFNLDGASMALCSCFSHITPSRNIEVEAWLQDRPWHFGEERRRQRCMDNCSGCAMVLLRSIFQNVVALEEKLLKQLLTSLASTVFPEVCRQTWQNANHDEEGFDKMMKLLTACAEPLESRAHIAGMLAKRLRRCLLSLVRVADAGDEDLATELRGWLIELDSSDVLSRESIDAQRCLLRRMVTDTWEVKCRDKAADCAYLV